ncbi:hypothetical protein FRC20_009108 [Serendipita sp. 405]|nr:hypothetical protein FRC20_009108 [Serendipita sp. 405]
MVHKRFAFRQLGSNPPLENWTLWSAHTYRRLPPPSGCSVALARARLALLYPSSSSLESSHAFLVVSILVFHNPPDSRMLSSPSVLRGGGEGEGASARGVGSSSSYRSGGETAAVG